MALRALNGHDPCECTVSSGWVLLGDAINCCSYSWLHNYLTSPTAQL